MLSFFLMHTTLIALFTGLVNAGRGGSFLKGLGVGIAISVLTGFALWGLLVSLSA